MSWGCRFDVQDKCARLNQPCHPGVKGCVLEGKVVFTRELDKKTAPREPAAPDKVRRAKADRPLPKTKATRTRATRTG